jgi:hypothetical protein
VKEAITGALVGGADVPPASPELPHARANVLAVAMAATMNFEKRREGTIEESSGGLKGSALSVQATRKAICPSRVIVEDHAHMRLM